MEFEKRLREKLLQEREQNLAYTDRYVSSSNYMNTHISDMFSYLLDAFEAYYRELYGSSKSDDDMIAEEDKIDEMLTDNALKNFLQENPLTEEELRCFKCVKLSRQWINPNAYPLEEEVLADLLLRKVMLHMYGKDALKRMTELLSTKAQEASSPYERKQCSYLSQLFSGEIIENSSKSYGKELKDCVDNDFNYRINCGGYALRIDDCVFPFGHKDFGKAVSTILERYPFTRLLSDRPLEPDEYLVIYRANDDGSGHHFIRVNDDDSVTEKNAICPIQTFEKWDEDSMHHEAVFAVKKEEARGFDSLQFKADRSLTGFNFEESINNAINNRQNNFSYHGHTFSLRKDSDREIIVISGEKVIADVIAEDGECAVEVKKGQEGFVENLQPPTPLVIKDGKLLNRSQIRKETQKEDDGR